MDKALGLLANIIDKLKVKEVVTALLITCIVILFVPDKFLETLGIVDWRNGHRTEIGGTLLICSILCLIWIVTWIFNEVRNGDWAAKRVSRAYLKRLISTDEKEFLIKHYFNFDTNEFDSCGKVDMTSGYLAPLTQAMIIYQATRVGHGVNHWAFNLQPDVRLYLNKAVRRGKIVVYRDGQYKWNL
ncbi:MAG: hypothetical protein HDR11_17055 [Lachnospiraceae bacterium]|nr:hypothetical protein [Lachnospiraceae bacterium]